MVVNKSAGGRALSLSTTTVNGTAAAAVTTVNAVQSAAGVPFLPKSPSFHSGLDLLAGRDKSSIIMYCDPTIHLSRLHGELSTLRVSSVQQPFPNINGFRRYLLSVFV